MNVLVIAAHPDDEVLGPGATVHGLSRQGARVEVLILCEGVGLRHPGVTLDQVRATAIEAAKQCGAECVHFGGFNQDGRLLDEVPNRKIVEAIAKHLSHSAAELVFTHHPGDIHVDHRIIGHATFYSLKVLAQTTVRRALCYQVLSSTEQSNHLTGVAFIPNAYYRIETEDLSAKIRALSLYTHELYSYPHPRSTEAVYILAQMRGIEIGVEAAEAFTLAREYVSL